MENKNTTKNKFAVPSVIFIIVGFALYFLISNWYGDHQETIRLEKSAEQAINYFSGNDWKEFNSVDGGFKILVPQYPKSDSTSINVPNSEIVASRNFFSSSDDNAEYYITSIYYLSGVDFSNPKANLEGGLNGRLNEIPNHQLYSSEFFSYPNGLGLNYLVKSDGYSINGRMILIGSKLFQLEMVCKTSKCVSPNFKKFTDSFSIN